MANLKLSELAYQKQWRSLHQSEKKNGQKNSPPNAIDKCEEQAGVRDSIGDASLLQQANIDEQSASNYDNISLNSDFFVTDLYNY